MFVVVLVLALFLAPVVLWFFGFNTLAVVALIYVLLSLPSINKMIDLAIERREWPKIAGGPNFFWAGKKKFRS